MIDWFNGLLRHGGATVHTGPAWWEVVGWLGNAVFSARFLVQWYATERRKQVVVPASFWWLSLAGSLLLLAYAIGQRRGAVMIFAYAFNWIPYVRNLVIQRRHSRAHRDCPGCGAVCQPGANYCSACGTRLTDAGRRP